MNEFNFQCVLLLILCSVSIGEKPTLYQCKAQEQIMQKVKKNDEKDNDDDLRSQGPVFYSKVEMAWQGFKQIYNIY